MAQFDFSNAQPPELEPLQASFEENEIESELKALTLHLWRKHAAAEAFDVNVLGMAHLGSINLVRQAITNDGLALLPNKGPEHRARYLYRAWKARNNQGRGLHFLRTYLQMLFPNISKVEQLWMPVDGTYPDDAISIIPEDEFILPRISDTAGLRLDGSWNVGGMIDTTKQGEDGEWSYDTSGLYLTSRVLITLDFSVDMTGVGNLLQILRTVLPARLVPVFQFSIHVESPVPVAADWSMEVEINCAPVNAYPHLRLVTEDPGMRWKLGKESAPDKAPRLQSSRCDYQEDAAV